MADEEGEEGGDIEEKVVIGRQDIEEKVESGR